MRRFPLLLISILVAGSAQAQAHPQAGYPYGAPTQQQLSSNEYGYMPQPVVPTPPQFAPAPAPIPRGGEYIPLTPKPGEYGVSVMTDIRQMNF
jgi:hypothetical protein